MEQRVGEAKSDTYYLDDRLSLDESTCRFSGDGRGREVVEEGFYVLAIRRRGFRDCLFRFSKRTRSDGESMVETLNRAAAAEAWPSRDRPRSHPEMPSDR